MKKPVVRLSCFKVCAMIALLFISIGCITCSKDKSDIVDDDNAKNTVTYNGHKYSLNLGAYEDYGYKDNHTNYAFHLFQMVDENDAIVPVYLYFDLYAPGEDGFKAGEFNYINTDVITDPSKLDGVYYFDDAYLATDIDTENESVGEYQLITEGSVKITGSDLDFRLVFNLKTEDGYSINGNYEGQFEPLSSASYTAYKELGRNFKIHKCRLPRER